MEVQRFVLQIYDKHVAVWREADSRKWPQNITIHDKFRGGNLVVAGALLWYCTELYFLRHGTLWRLWGARHQKEVLDPAVRFYTLNAGSAFLLIGDNSRNSRYVIVEDYLKSNGFTDHPIEKLSETLGHVMCTNFLSPVRVGICSRGSIMITWIYIGWSPFGYSM